MGTGIYDPGLGLRGLITWSLCHSCRGIICFVVRIFSWSGSLHRLMYFPTFSSGLRPGGFRSLANYFLCTGKSAWSVRSSFSRVSFVFSHWFVLGLVCPCVRDIFFCVEWPLRVWTSQPFWSSACLCFCCFWRMKMLIWDVSYRFGTGVYDESRPSGLAYMRLEWTLPFVIIT